MRWKQLANPNNDTYDVIITTTPWVETNIPLMAPAALKPIVEKAGLSCLAIDLNIEIVRYCKELPNGESLANFINSAGDFLDPKIEQEASDIFDSITDSLISFNPKYVGFSLLSVHCQLSTKWLCYFLKKKDPGIKIILGGSGCYPTATGLDSSFIKNLFKFKMIDYHIKGDGEHSLYELLIGNESFSGINSESWTQLNNQDLITIPTPNYENYEFDFYEVKAIGLVGSRGCVRQCTFCDYISFHKKFYWRTAEHIFNEMIEQYSKHGITAFKLNDSLVNGNMKEFTKLLQLMGDYNRKNPDAKFSWAGFYIFREIVSESAEQWKMLSESGAFMLNVGIENFNQHIRYAMGKKFSDQAIIFHLEHALKYNIQCNLLCIVGYITETQEDIDNIKKWLYDNIRFKNIIAFYWGLEGLGINDGTYLGNNKKELGITMIGNKSNEWVSKHTTSTPDQRRQWVVELTELSEKLGYTYHHYDEGDNHAIMEKYFMKRVELPKNEWLIF